MVRDLLKEREANRKKFSDILQCYGFKLVDNNEYINAKTKINIICPNNHIEYIIPFYFSRRPYCKKCREIKRHKEYYNELILKIKEEKCILKRSVFNLKYRTKIDILCPNGHFNKDVVAGYFINNGIKCKYCTREYHSNKFFNELKKEKYKYLSGEYKSNRSLFIVKCPNRHRINITPSNFLRGKRCPYCVGNVKRSTASFKKEMFDKVKNEYTVVGEYISNHKKVRIRHNKEECNYYEWSITPSNFLNHGKRCPICRGSKGEKSIASFLDGNNIKYKPQKTFNDLKIDSLLKFDFYLSDFNVLIEYDGEHHFNPVDYNSKGADAAKNKYIKQLKYDKIKNKYCIDNNIPLIRIPYWEKDNIQYILENSLKYLNVIENIAIDLNNVKKYHVSKNWDHDKYLSLSKSS